MQHLLTKRVKNIKPSPTMAISAKAAQLKSQGQDIIGLGAGEPDFDTPEHIKQAAITAINSGKTRYTPAGGTKELKDAICQKFEAENQLTYSPEEVIASCGAKHSIYNLIQAVISKGDEVIIPAPYWVSYPDMVILAGGTPVIVGTSMEDGFKLTPQILSEKINPQTKLLIINSPSNPTGSSYSKKELEDLGKIVEQYPNLIVLTDDIYEHIYWGQERFYNLPMVCPNLKKQTVVINGVSKAYAMTGWRIGYAAGDKDIIKAMSKIQSQSTSNPCSIAQEAAIAALCEGNGCIAPMLEQFKLRHDYVIARLNSMKHIKCNAATGAFYAFPYLGDIAANTEGLTTDSSLCESLLEKSKIALVPGSAFGAPGYARLSFATSKNDLEIALDRLEQYINEYSS